MLALLRWVWFAFLAFGLVYMGWVVVQVLAFITRDLF